MKATTLLILFFLGLGFLLPRLVHGAESGSDAHFISVDEIAIDKLLPPPPGNYSPETAAEIRQILLLQKQKTPEQVAIARQQDQLTPAVFCSSLFPQWTAQQTSRIADLLSLVGGDAEQIANLSKRIWDRPRPSRLEKKIEKLVDLPPGSAYPGTNATVAYTWAAILSALIPNQKDAITAAADLIGKNRVLAGVQYPSDVEAGKTLGMEIARKLLAKPEFQAALKNTFAEAQVPSANYATNDAGVVAP